jgi:hypothetical protein
VRYVLLAIDGPGNPASGNEIAAIDAFNDRLTAGNHLVLAAGIADPTRATLFDNRSGAGIERPGSLFSGPEHYSGFWIVDAESVEAAAQLARDASNACNRKVELRPFLG